MGQRRRRNLPGLDWFGRQKNENCVQKFAWFAWLAQIGIACEVANSYLVTEVVHSPWRKASRFRLDKKRLRGSNALWV